MGHVHPHPQDPQDAVWGGQLGEGGGGSGQGQSQQFSHLPVTFQQSQPTRPAAPERVSEATATAQPLLPPPPASAPSQGPCPERQGLRPISPGGASRLFGENSTGGGGGWGGPSLLPCVLSASISFQKLAAELEMSPHQHLRLSRLQLQFPQRGQESTGSSSITSLAHPSTPPPTSPSLSTRL